MQKLIDIQSELKAPKGNYNSFGKFNYRSCEDILEAVKPLCVKNGCLLTLSDDMCEIGARYYIKATATIMDIETKESVSVSAFAREAESKKGMDDAQATGATSSYARKYALNGLFCIDDAKDPDTDEHAKQQQEAARKEAAKKRESKQAPKEQKKGQEAEPEPDPEQFEKISPFQVDEVVEMCDNHHKDTADMCKYFSVSAVEEMSVAQYRELKKIFRED